jgi:hypothetical protein
VGVSVCGWAWVGGRGRGEGGSAPDWREGEGTDVQNIKGGRKKGHTGKQSAERGPGAQSYKEKRRERGSERGGMWRPSQPTQVRNKGGSKRIRLHPNAYYVTHQKATLLSTLGSQTCIRTTLPTPGRPASLPPSLPPSNPTCTHAPPTAREMWWESPAPP